MNMHGKINNKNKARDIIDTDKKFIKYIFNKYDDSNSPVNSPFTKDGLILTANVRFPAAKSVFTSLILLTHSKDVERLPKIMPSNTEGNDTKSFCK